MAGKTKKDLQSENTLLKEELSNVKHKLAELSEKYENLQTKGKSTTFVERNISLRCQKCYTNFESLTDLKNHKHEHRVNGDVLSVTNVIKNSMKNGNYVPMQKSIRNTCVNSAAKPSII